jgi:hypothetical protein
MGPIGPMSVRRLYRRRRGSLREGASWNEVDAIDPEATVAWDAMGGAHVAKLDVIDGRIYALSRREWRTWRPDSGGWVPWDRDRAAEDVATILGPDSHVRRYTRATGVTETDPDGLGHGRGYAGAWAVSIMDADVPAAGLQVDVLDNRERLPYGGDWRSLHGVDPRELSTIAHGIRGGA